VRDPSIIRMNSQFQDTIEKIDAALEEEVLRRVQEKWSGSASLHAEQYVEIIELRQALAKANARIGELKAALDLYRKAKAFVAADDYDGIDRRGRELLEEADSCARAALGAKADG